MSLENIQNLNADFCRDNAQSILLKQYEKNSRIIIVKCTENGIFKKLDKNTMKCHIKVLTPDDRALYNDCEILEDGTVKVSVTEGMVYASGVAKAELNVIDTGTEALLATMVFNMIIKPSAYSDDKALGDNDVNSITALILKLNNIESNVTAAISNANSAAANANTVANQLLTDKANGLFKGDKGDKGDPGSDGNVTVDTSLSLTSINPVQNKVVTTELNKKVSSTDINTELLNKLGESSEGTLTFNGSEIKTNTDYIADTIEEAQAAVEAGLVEEGASIYVKEISGADILMDTEMSDNSTNPVQNNVIKKYVDNEVSTLKKSVSDGKTLVAAAITDKGVETAADATFDIMAANIALIESGNESSVLSLNVFTQETEPETKDGVWIQTTNSHQSVFISTTEIAESSGSETIKWESNINLPYDFKNGSAVVYNNEIHILGSATTDANTGTYHYKFDGATWSEAPTLPYKFNSGSAVVYNNEIHILGNGVVSTRKYHYKFDGATWSEVSTLPYDFYSGSAVVYNNEIHILGSPANSSSQKSHYKFDGTTWSKASTLPYNFYYGSAIVYNNEIHIFGGGNTSTRKYHYKFDGTTWSKASTLPYDFYRCSVVVYNNEIHILGGGTTNANTGTYHYKFDGATWSEVSTLPYDFKNGSAVIYNEKIHILGGDNSLIKNYSYTLSSIDNVNASRIVIYQNPSNDTGIYATNFISGVPITGENNKFPSGFDNVYYIDDFGNVEKSPTYYGDGTQWIKLKN